MPSANREKAIVADLFCGAGGTSTGVVLACNELNFDLELLAINHWNIAIDTHKANHPTADHRCESLDNVNPRQVVPGGRLTLLVASPECTHHSNARGGKPVSDQSRASAWHILRWAEALYIENILVENVKEFMSWGPIGSSGRPLKSKRGETFLAFVGALRSLGYTVEYRLLVAADYGDATTRERLFIMARRGGKKIIWPQPTHAPLDKLQRGNVQKNIFSQPVKMKPWTAARKIIDRSIPPGESIFRRKKPLAKKTMERIAAGAKKFWGFDLQPFLVVFQNNRDAVSLDEPLPTVLTSGAHFGLCEPFVLNIDHHGGNGNQVRSVDQPLSTVTTKARAALVEPFLIAVNHGDSDASSPRPARSIDDPLPTLTCKRSHGLVQPFIVKYYSTGIARSVDEPLDTITTKDRFALVEIDGRKCELDIRFRMLQPHELAAAQGFRNYKFTGNRAEIVKQIGNAVPVNLAKALCRSVLQ